ncbi:MAG: PhoH family protein [Betaproteobacteria bacterium]|nr:PhoH family protein [Betaproteobacteria bacterium]
MKTPSIEFSFTPVDNRRLMTLCGSMDANVRQIEAALDVSIARRGEKFSVSGERDKIELAAKVLNRFYAKAHNDLSVEEIQLGIVEMSHARDSRDNKAAAAAEVVDEEIALHTRRADLRARTDRQSQYIRQMQTHDITFGVGPAGTGKTYLAVACAVDAFERDLVKRIVLTRPAVEAGEKLGFLPGDLSQKTDPYLRPLYDALYDLLGFDKVNRMFERQQIEVAPLAFMRGRTLNHSFIILDEAQNTTPEQMKMFLTRIGFGTKAVITGDVTQVDLKHGTTSGLIDARNVLNGIRGIAFTIFQANDVVRHPLVQSIVTAYEAHHRGNR